jgi:hypothetical protein
MRLLCLLLAATALTGCGFEDPPSAAAPSVAPIPSDFTHQDPCTAYAVVTLDGLLNGLPSVSPETAVKANEVVQQFVQQYDAVITSQGIEAARAEYADDIEAACKG